jgi:hypothetical protein
MGRGSLCLKGIFAVTVVAASVVTTAGSGRAGPGATALALQARTSYDGASSVLVTGSVARSGRGVSADVVAVAWPNADVQSRLAVGARVPTRAVAAAHTDAWGRFAVTLAPDLLPGYVRDRQGRVDVQLLAADSREELGWNFTAAPAAASTSGLGRPGTEGARTGWRPGGSPAAVHPVSVALDLDSGTVQDVDADRTGLVSDGRSVREETGAERSAATRTLVVRRTPAVTEGVVAARALRTSPAMRAALRRSTATAGRVPRTRPDLLKDTCHNSAGRWHYGLQEQFLTAYGWSGAKAKVTETVETTHTLGIGVLGSGSAHQNGTRTVSATASAESATNLMDQAVFNKVNYRDYFNSCYPTTWRRPVSVSDLLSKTPIVLEKRFATCAYKISGTYTKSSNRNATYSGGVDIGPVNVSAQSGYSSSTSISWTVRNVNKGLKTALCGNTRSGWASSSQAEAHPVKR